jgi:hypothetical protein
MDFRRTAGVLRVVTSSRGPGENAGGNNPTATAAIVTHNPAQGQALPLPPTDRPAAEHSDLIKNPPETVECSAPQH